MSKQVICCIPVRNGAATIERAIKSAWDKGVDDVYVFDDSSTDATDYILYGLEIKHSSCLKVFNLGSKWSHVGVNVARNYLIEQIDDDDALVICLDSDDTLHEIAPLVAVWKNDTFVYGNHNEVNGDSITEHKGAPIKTLPNKMVTGVTFLFAKSDWELCGGFNPNYAFCEDYAMMCNFIHNGINGVYVDHTVYNRYLDPKGNTRTILAGEYWNFYHQMCRRDYPNVWK